MIALTRLNGTSFALNSDLIERIETTPDTVLVLLDGSRYLVSEPLEEIVGRVRRHRAEVISMCHSMEEEAPSLGAPGVTPLAPRALRVVTGGGED
jgi:flagellar protein FlbD